MQTPQSEASDRPPKRMRIGTKSCAECRRRKVRCIFEEEQQSCRECIVHEAQCVPQQPRPQGQGGTRKRYEGNMQQRLEELEGMVSHICKAIDVDIESVSIAEFKSSTGEALKRLRPLSSPGTSATESTSTRRTESLTTSESGNFYETPDDPDSGEDAPLLSLFKDVMVIQRNPQLDKAQPNVHVSRRANTCVEALGPLLPTTQDLTDILKASQPYWFIWPVSPASLDRHRPVTNVDSAREFILDSLRSGVPTRAAKAIIWLALCVQQLSTDFIYRRQLPASPNVLLDSYMSSADTLLSISNDSEGTLEDLQCVMLHAKLYINMGKPRKAWLKVRQALNISILLGLPNQKAGANEHGALWSHIWQLDRTLSLILGFPYGITESHPGLSRELTGDYFLSKAMHDISIVAGHIVDRNQSGLDVDYSVTLQIEQELQRCRAVIPQEWWNANPTPDMPLSELYYRQTFKIYYYQALKHLHLPYMLKSSTDKNLEHSRNAALESSREMMSSYRGLRSTGESQIIMCDLMDFQAFSSALVMVLGLVSQAPTCIYQEAEDWGLVQSVIRQLQTVASGMECTVANQGAQLLEYLSMAHSGTYSGPDGYEAMIPYFGKVRIGKMKRNESAAPLGVESKETPLLTTDIMDLNTISFMPFSSESLVQYPLTDAELGVDWTSVFDVDNNYNYDWSQVFDYRGP